MDIDSIPPGMDYVAFLQSWVDQADIMLVLIGPRWLASTAPNTHKPRLLDSKDFVRIEIQRALDRGIRTVPVLLDGASMPNPDELPEDIRTLTRQQAEFIDFRTFDSDIDRLARRLRIGQKRNARMIREAVALGIPAGLVCPLALTLVSFVVSSFPVYFRTATTSLGMMLDTAYSSLTSAFILSVAAAIGAGTVGRTSLRKLFLGFAIAGIVVSLTWMTFFIVFSVSLTEILVAAAIWFTITMPVYLALARRFRLALTCRDTQ